MLERYKKELELREIYNLDSLNEDGTFKKELINKDGKYETGYTGVIRVHDFNNVDDIYNVEVIYVRDDKNERRLVCDNYNGTFIQADLSLLEDRDPVTLFEDYCKDANIFLEIQKWSRCKHYMLYKATGIDQQEKEDIIASLDKQIETLQNELESCKKM